MARVQKVPIGANSCRSVAWYISTQTHIFCAAAMAQAMFLCRCQGHSRVSPLFARQFACEAPRTEQGTVVQTRTVRFRVTDGLVELSALQQATPVDKGLQLKVRTTVVTAHL